MSKRYLKRSERWWVFFVVLVVLSPLWVRGCFLENFKIPSASMVPTLLIGDYILVNKVAYGFRMPTTKIWLKNWGQIKRGDVVVFMYPPDEKVAYVKRVVGLPGDKVQVVGSELYLNGKKVEEYFATIQGVRSHASDLLDYQRPLGLDQKHFLPSLPYFEKWQDMLLKEEKLDAGFHHTLYSKEASSYDADESRREFVVPEGQLFVLGDNRDNSSDSRTWGMVPRQNLIGRAWVVLFSLQHQGIPFRPHRFGHVIH
ncbi:MAG: signal peptidase I [Deltaproteobacteria bacterium]|nr:signal peptidase I [Deltaproteobacteria bacterium]